MQREIKFRGKRIDTGSWVYGDLCQDPDIEMVSILKKSDKPYALSDSKEADTYFYFKLIQVDPETVGQFTGFKANKDIYEGDKCDTYTRFGKGVVVWENGMFKINGISLATFIGKLEVIGNVFENQELLEEKQ